MELLIILKMQIIYKILSIYKLYRIEDEKFKKLHKESSKELNYVNTSNKKLTIWTTSSKRLEVLKCLKNILESDIKLQRTFIIEKGIEILLTDIVSESTNINEVISDQLNEMILRVIYVVSCNINKLFLIYFNSSEVGPKNDNMFDYSSDNNSSEEDKNDKLLLMNNTEREKNPKNKINLDNSNSNSENSSNLKENEDEENADKNNYYDYNRRKDKLLQIFKEQLSEKNS